MAATRGPGPRERLLAAATTLSYRHGVSVGLDALLSEASVARRSLYQHFGGKDNLIAEVLSEAGAADRELLADRMERAGERGAARVRAVLEFFLDRAEAPTFRGCRYAAADLGLPDPRHPAHQHTLAHYDHVHGLLAAELTALGHRDAEGAADRLQLIIDGALVQRGTRPAPGSAVAARALFDAVLAEIPHTDREEAPDVHS
ncbi:TetR/AcrR family transcriptional regulator [Pseudonocardia spinosispora]|uniref:TetR/AcrR family transcriptional regulator n=1 Tax=Pseudonocardia spinosispora TaxID=103441 RepID=UPI000413428A|nr:TetR/AcrR family transcriptional regulator [Pseudonocardia spinosispora]